MSLGTPVRRQRTAPNTLFSGFSSSACSSRSMQQFRNTESAPDLPKILDPKEEATSMDSAEIHLAARSREEEPREQRDSRMSEAFSLRRGRNFWRRPRRGSQTIFRDASNWER